MSSKPQKPSTPHKSRKHEARGGAAPKRGGGKLARAKLRHFFFTVAPDRITRGLLRRRHLERPIELREITLHVPDWPEKYQGLRIAHVSDFHLGELMPMTKALEVVGRVEKAKPDLLACTGDVVDLEWQGAQPLLEAMGSVEAPLGRFLVLGNHDHLDDPASLVRAARRRGLVVLEDEVVDAMERARGGRGGPGVAAAAPRGARATADEAAEASSSPGALRVGGIDWARTPRELGVRLERLRKRPDLLLAHNPKAFPAAARLGVPLTLAGHTHGGQVGLPDRTVKPRVVMTPVGPIGVQPAGDASTGATGAKNDPVALALRRAAPAQARLRALRRGLYAQGPSRLFVNVGAGSWFPARVNCPAEILMLTIER